jgi:sugar/nucleoside kinase (ribokinase family)
MVIEECMELAAAASSLAITKKGAVPSIPLLVDVKEYLTNH